MRTRVGCAFAGRRIQEPVNAMRLTPMGSRKAVDDRTGTAIGQSHCDEMLPTLTERLLSRPRCAARAGAATSSERRDSALIDT